MTVHVSERVRERWRELSALFQTSSLSLLFASALPQRDALAAVRGAAEEAMAERVERSDREEFSPGATLVAPAPGGIVLLIDHDPDDLEGLLAAIAPALERRGVEGTFDLYEPPATVALPDLVPLLECRLRVKGMRPPSNGLIWRWRADPGSLARGVEAGLVWCRDGRDDQEPLQLHARTMPPIVLGPDEDVHVYLRHALESTAEVGVVRLTSTAPDRFRTLAISPSLGRITLVEGGPVLEHAGWRSSFRALEDWMGSSASWAVYGFLKRGSRRSTAELGTSLSDDWPTVPHFSANSLLGQAFEDEWAPDAFGAQLLGPGYAGRLPEGPDWTHAPTGFEGVIIEHVDPESWFDGRLVPLGGRRLSTDAATEPVPTVLERARADFAEILFRDEIARGR